MILCRFVSESPHETHLADYKTFSFQNFPVFVMGLILRTLLLMWELLMKNEDLNRKQKRRKRDPNLREGQYLVGRRDAPNLIPSVDRTSTEHRRLSQRVLKVFICRLFLTFKQRNTVLSSMSAPNRVPDSQPRYLSLWKYGRLA